MAYRSPWISLSEARKHVAAAVGKTEAWPQIRNAIRDGKLEARAICDGIEKKFHGGWLAIVAWPDPDWGQDVLFFDNDKLNSVTPPAPELAEKIEVNGEIIREFWPVAVAGTPGPKRGEASPKNQYCEAAGVLIREGRAPKRPNGHFNVAAIAQAIADAFPNSRPTTIEKYIRDTVRELERNISHKSQKSGIRKSGK